MLITCSKDAVGKSSPLLEPTAIMRVCSYLNLKFPSKNSLETHHLKTKVIWFKMPRLKKKKEPFETGIPDPINNRFLLNFWMNPQTSRCPFVIILNSTWKILTFYSSNHYSTLDKILNKFHQFELRNKGQYQQFCRSRCKIISESIIQMTCDDIKWTAQYCPFIKKTKIIISSFKKEKTWLLLLRDNWVKCRTLHYWYLSFQRLDYREMVWKLI